MKKLFLLTVIVVTAQFAFGTDAPVASTSAMTSFNKDFYNTSSAQWQHSEAYDKVDFFLDTQFLNAYYAPDGDLLAVTRNIVSEQLPLKLLMELKKNYSGYWISDLFEVVNGTDDDYYVTLENADEQIILKAKASKSWKLYKKVVKI